MHIILIFIWIFSIFSANAEINQSLPVKIRLLNFQDDLIIPIPYYNNNNYTLINFSNLSMYKGNFTDGFRSVKFENKPIGCFYYKNNFNIIFDNKMIKEFNEKLNNDGDVKYYDDQPIYGIPYNEYLLLTYKDKKYLDVYKDKILYKRIILSNIGKSITITDKYVYIVTSPIEPVQSLNPDDIMIFPDLGINIDILNVSDLKLVKSLKLSGIDNLALEYDGSKYIYIGLCESGELRRIDTLTNEIDDKFRCKSHLIDQIYYDKENKLLYISNFRSGSDFSVINPEQSNNIMTWKVDQGFLIPKKDSNGKLTEINIISAFKGKINIIKVIDILERIGK